MDQVYKQRSSVEITKKQALDLVRTQNSPQKPAITFSIYKLEDHTYFQKNTYAAFFLNLLKTADDKCLTDPAELHLMIFLAGHLLKIASQNEPVRSLNMYNLHSWYGRYTASSKVGPNIIEFLKRLTPTQHGSEDDYIVRRTFRSKLPREIRKYRRRQFLSDNLRNPCISDPKTYYYSSWNHIEIEKKLQIYRHYKAYMAETIDCFNKFKSRREFSRLYIQDHSNLFDSSELLREPLQKIRTVSPLNLNNHHKTNSTRKLTNKEGTQRDIKTARPKIRRILRGNCVAESNSFRFLTYTYNILVQNIYGLTLQKHPTSKYHQSFLKVFTKL